jgi:hypothetical protein
VALIRIQGFWEIALALVRLLVVVSNAGLHYTMSIQPTARDAATFVNCAYNTKKSAQLFRRLDIPFMVIFPHADREQSHNNGCGPVP